MLKAYVNYPNPKVSVHRNPLCGEIQKMHKQGQRVIRLDVSTLSAELQKFARKEYTFAANPSGNDMWLEADFGDAEFEFALIAHIQKIVGSHYEPLSRVIIERHC